MQITWQHAGALQEALALDAQGTAYVMAAGVLRAINPQGRELWQYRFRAPPGSPPDVLTTAPRAALGPGGELYVSDDSASSTVVLAA